RRAFLGTAAAAAGAAALLGRAPWAVGADAPAAAAGGKPNSVINGVKIGCITYSYRPQPGKGGLKINTAEETLAALLKDGLSEVELMDGPIKAYTGIGSSKAPTDAEREAQLKKCVELRKMYNDAGVNIHIHKIPFGASDAEAEFNFLVAKALGCVAITTERNEALAKRLAPMAEKHKVYVAFHNHTKNFPSLETMDPILDVSKYIAFNFDIGHYVGGTKGKHPNAMIEKYHDRIISLHLKDKTTEDRNMPWGTGNTPIKDVLQLLKKEKWPIYGDIELEYPVPADSDSVTEVGKCLDFCRKALA
ncbi:MAG TPA: TIM barrel protein, partial [Humisphaera sp.]